MIFIYNQNVGDMEIQWKVETCQINYNIFSRMSLNKITCNIYSILINNSAHAQLLLLSACKQGKGRTFSQYISINITV